MHRFPEDLYIPPDALEIILDAFEGPLDLLLYLIKRQNLDIRDIPIAEITRQYMDYVELMKEFRLDLAAEYLVMAALLAEIKSRLLLPRLSQKQEEDDPRAELVRRLQEYEQCKQAAEALDQLPRLEREHWQVQTAMEVPKQDKPLPEVDLKELLVAFQAVLKRAAQFKSHQVQREPLSIRARMTKVLLALQAKSELAFSELFTLEEGRRGVVVSLMAILELLKAHVIEISQADEVYAPLYIRLATAESA
ncbi:ScpA family protein [uncultured Thiothrix sp.]|uniref:segregation and condensation protein A n=1 Tax=uncultured Thiothrix sp. TaxID=223185 RepID=UPI00261BDBB2|nr:ScpA family protein [uncultured Thiothrix sp.]